MLNCQIFNLNKKNENLAFIALIIANAMNQSKDLRVLLKTEAEKI